MALKILLGIIAAEFTVFIYLFVQAFPLWEQVPELINELKEDRKAREALAKALETLAKKREGK
jgi:hypothetical protein